jgi:predicted transcriptional regulator
MARQPELERRVIDTLWRGGEWSVREVHEEVGGGLAYTTIATVLDRLCAKGRVKREKDGVSWRYQATRTREEALAAEVGRMMEREDGASEPLLVAFLDEVEQRDPNALDRLMELIRARQERT